MTQALSDRGDCFRRLGDVHTAALDYTRLIEMSNAPPSQVARAARWRGDCYLKTGDREQAMADYASAAANYTKVIESKDSSADMVASALDDRGVCYGRMGEKEKAAADYAQALAILDKALEGKNVPAAAVASDLQTRAWYAYHAGLPDRALDDSRRALLLSPSDAGTAYIIAITLVRQGKFDEAKKAYAAAFPLGSPLGPGGEDDLVELRDHLDGPPEATVFLGWIYLQAGQRERGVKELQKYVDGHADTPLAGWARELLTTGAAGAGAQNKAAQP